MQHWLTWANLLTALRLVLIMPTAHAILGGRWWLGSVLFVVAAATDFFDGLVARRLNQASPLGGLFDHTSDALYVTVSCWALAEIGLINPYLCWLIPAAFVQYALDSKALSGHALRTSAIGRGNGVAYFIAVGVGIGANAVHLPELLPALAIFGWLLVASTILSMLDRGVTLVKAQSASRSGRR